MMERTDRYFRIMMRGITKSTLLYTPMITAPAILRGPGERLLDFDELERPLSLQLGGDDPHSLADCARLAEARGYDEVNLNVGCPSDRVQGGNFGACLMRDPQRVADCYAAMASVVNIPVTIKHRIGIDELDRYEDMRNFVDVIAAAGCTRFSVHARKAWLEGLSPKQNRTIPPLRHEEVYRLKAERPSLWIETNGGIVDLDETQVHLEHLDAVMIGRAAWDNPMLFAEVDRRFFASRNPAPTRRQVVEAYLPWAEKWLSEGRKGVGVLRNLLSLFKGQPGTKLYKQRIGALCQRPPTSEGGLREALSTILDEVDGIAQRMREHRGVVS
jgi:tRNA-dihydrouridine synthase A